MPFQYFSENQIMPFLFSALLLLLSILFFTKGKLKSSLVLLFIGSLGLGYFIVNLDPFLNLWDEQYHALVAKHLSQNFLKPTLYSIPLLEYDYRNWTGNHIWLHKQPLFLWQMALSIKLFGTTTFAVRLPSIILHSLITLMIFRIGKISISERVRYYGALFFAVAYYPLELVSGHFSTDHNDVTFLFYITASIWAWFEYQHSQKKHYLILIRLFSGCAILVKWLVGLLIYAIWFLTIGISDKRNWIRLKLYFPIIVSLSITFLVIIPWQVYITSNFPRESSYEFAYNTKHFFEPIEDHGGGIWFHIDALKEIYGSGILIPFLYLFGLIIFIKNTQSKIYKVAIASTILITYLFYSLASTKMVSFCVIVSPFFFLGISSLVEIVMRFVKEKIKSNCFNFSLRSIILVVICFFILNLNKIQNHHADLKQHGNRNTELAEMHFIRKLTSQFGTEKCVIFNANIRLNGHIPIMFFTDYIAYDIIPTLEQIEKIQSQNYKIAILDDATFPDYILSNPGIIKMTRE